MSFDIYFLRFNIETIVLMCHSLFVLVFWYWNYSINVSFEFVLSLIIDTIILMCHSIYILGHYIVLQCCSILIITFLHWCYIWCWRDFRHYYYYIFILLHGLLLLTQNNMHWMYFYATCRTTHLVLNSIKWMHDNKRWK